MNVSISLNFSLLLSLIIFSSPFVNNQILREIVGMMAIAAKYINMLRIDTSICRSDPP